MPATAALVPPPPPVPAPRSTAAPVRPAGVVDLRHPTAARRRRPEASPSLPVMEDRELVERFRTGDADAVREVYQRYGGSVHAVARRSLSDASLAEEAVQQTFLQAWRAAGSVDPDRDLGPWLYTIARRVAIDLYRRESRRSAESYDDEGGAAASVAAATLVTLPPSLEGAWDAWQVRQAVDGLPDHERDVVRLQHFEGLTHPEIAERLDLPVGTVKSRSHRAHRRLAGLLGHVLDEEVPA